MNIKLDNVPVSSDKESSGIQTKLGLASGAVAAGILASDAVSTKARENNVQNSTSILESHFDDNIMAIPADMDSTRGVVDQQVQYNNLQSEGSLENNPLLTSKENYLDSVATSDASGLLLQNSKGREHDTIPNDDTATMPIITTRNEVKDESNMTSSQAVLSMDTDSTGAHYQQGPLVLTETQPLTLNLDKSSHLTSTIDSSGDLKAIPTETLGSDNIVLGPGGNAGDGSTINSSYPTNDNIGEKSRGNMPNKLESGMALASTASVVGATAAVASSRNDNSNVEPPNELNHATEESLNKMYSEGYKGVETSDDVSHRNVNRTLVQGIPIESEVAGAASSTSGQIVDFKALSEKQSSLIIPIKQKDTLGPLKMDKNDSKKSTTSSNNTGEKQDSRRSSSILASAALTAASAVAAGIFANKGVKKSKEKKAEKMNQLNDSVAADMHESALPVTNEYNKDKLVVEPTPPVTGTLASDPKATEADIPKVVVTPTLNDKGVDRVSGQNMSTGNAPSPDIDARGKNVSQAFNLNDSIAPALGSTAGVAAATATTGAVLSHDVNHTNGSSGAIVNTQSKESDTQPRIGHDVQTKKSFGTGIPEIPVPVTATQASSQNPGYSSVKEKESYDNKTTRSKNSSLAKDKSSTSSLKKLFNRLSFRKKDPFVDTDDDM
ncbi:hypothetical protein K502DRAFT_146032 [Neoconidiobolus thromboides FSU 785]|nr:hypothetical protein K502DRAFT_146032 [Neoconidiobolus thromboides FSU 785]